MLFRISPPSHLNSSISPPIWVSYPPRYIPIFFPEGIILVLTLILISQPNSLLSPPCTLAGAQSAPHPPTQDTPENSPRWTLNSKVVLTTSSVSLPGLCAPLPLGTSEPTPELSSQPLPIPN